VAGAGSTAKILRRWVRQA